MWKPGTKYTMTDGYKTVILEETFEQKTAITAMRLRSDDTREGGNYFLVGDTSIELLGATYYTSAGEYAGKYVYSTYRIPTNMTPGQTIENKFIETHEPVSGSGGTQLSSEKFTFVGLEDVELAGRKFTDTCKIKAFYSENGNVFVGWVAKGFGFIKSERQDPQGVLVANSHVELASIEAAP
jgi:hypothetical protein